MVSRGRKKATQPVGWVAKRRCHPEKSTQKFCKLNYKAILLHCQETREKMRQFQTDTPKENTGIPNRHAEGGKASIDFPPGALRGGVRTFAFAD